VIKIIFYNPFHNRTYEFALLSLYIIVSYNRIIVEIHSLHIYTYIIIQLSLFSFQRIGINSLYFNGIRLKFYYNVMTFYFKINILIMYTIVYNVRTIFLAIKILRWLHFYNIYFLFYKSL